MRWFPRGLACHSSEKNCWEPVTSVLEKQGHRTFCVDLPTEDPALKKDYATAFEAD